MNMWDIIYNITQKEMAAFGAGMGAGGFIVSFIWFHYGK